MFSTSACTIRQAYRVRATAPAASDHNPNDDRLLAGWDDKLGGRIMTAACSVGINEPLSIESVVRGRASASGCGLSRPNVYRSIWMRVGLSCCEELAARERRDWHRDLCGKLAAITDASTRANRIRVVCLLAIVIQAAASGELFSWLIENLRPMNDDRTHPLWESTRGFGQRFANAIPAPPDPKQENNKTANGGSDDMFSSSWFAIPADGGAKAAGPIKRRN